MELRNPEKKPILYYYMIAIAVLLILNTFVFPLLFQPQVSEVTYNEFMTRLDQGQVKAVQRTDTEILFACEEGDKTTYYKTGLWADDGLTQRLMDKGVDFASEIPAQNSPLLSFLISWLLPIAFFLFLGRMLSKKMSGLGGNAMSFGKANAKIYAENETGKSFQDVAGEDEAHRDRGLPAQPR